MSFLFSSWRFNWGEGKHWKCFVPANNKLLTDQKQLNQIQTLEQQNKEFSKQMLFPI